MYGDQDWIDFKPMQRKIAELPKEKQFELEFIPDSTHMNIMQKPKEVNKLIFEWFEKFEVTNKIRNIEEMQFFKTNNKNILSSIRNFDDATLLSRRYHRKDRCASLSTLDNIINKNENLGSEIEDQ